MIWYLNLQKKCPTRTLFVVIAIFCSVAPVFGPPSRAEEPNKEH